MRVLEHRSTRMRAPCFFFAFHHVAPCPYICLAPRPQRGEAEEGRSISRNSNLALLLPLQAHWSGTSS